MLPDDREGVKVSRGDSLASPADSKVVCIVDQADCIPLWPQYVLDDDKEADIILTDQIKNLEDIYTARTFCLYEDIEEIKSIGLVAGFKDFDADICLSEICLLYTSPSPRDKRQSRMPSSA